MMKPEKLFGKETKIKLEDYTMELVRTISDFDRPEVTVCIFDMHETNIHFEKMVWYEVYLHGDVILGEEITISSNSNAEDDEIVATILHYISMTPTDNDEYSLGQSDFLKEYGEMLGEYANDLMGV